MELLLEVSFESGEFQLVPATNDRLGTCIVPVLGIIDDRPILLGTAFAISRLGLLLTARHVVEDYLKGIDDDPEDPSRLLVLFESSVPIQGKKDSVFGSLFPVATVAWHPVADLAILQTEVPKHSGGRAFYAPMALHVGLPHVGQRCAAVGYAHMALSGHISEGTLDYERQLAVAQGKIEDVHPEQRDSSRLNFPCFLTDARYDRGMSGSPVAIDDGRVAGVVCSSTEPSEGQPYTSYATLLKPALEIAVPMRRGPGTPTKPTSVAELADAGMVRVTR
jgi:S1-C subfamily serine protease